MGEIMRKRKYRKSHNANFIIMAIFSITFLFVGLAYANTNYTYKLTGTAGVASNDQTQTTLTLSHSILDIEIGEKYPIIATVKPANGSEVIIWTSSNPEFVTVDSNGVVTAIGEGNSTITAEYNGLKANCYVNVIEGGQIDYSEYLMVDINHNNNYNGNTIWYATVTITNISGLNFKTWSCELVFPSIGTYNLNNNSCGVKIDGNVFSGENLSSSITLNGQISITKGYQIENYLPIEIKNVQFTLDDSGEDIAATAIQINAYNETLLEGQTKIISTTITPLNATSSIIWTSSNEKVATVKSGLVRAISPGTTTITASIDSLSASCTITVEEAPDLEGITINNTELDLQVGDSTKLIATKNPENASGTITWVSSDENVVTIDKNGNVKAIGIGIATISAICEGFSATCEVTVSDVDYNTWIAVEFIPGNYTNNTMYFSQIIFKNNSKYDFNKWSGTISWPDGTAITVYNYTSSNAANSLEYTLEGTTVTGGFFIFGSTIEMTGQLVLPDGKLWDDYKDIQPTLTNIQIEHN